MEVGAWVGKGSVGGTVSVGVFSREGVGLGDTKGAAQAGTKSTSRSNCFIGLYNCGIMNKVPQTSASNNECMALPIMSRLLCVRPVREDYISVRAD